MVNWFRVVSREKVRGRGESLSVSDTVTRVTRRRDPRGVKIDSTTAWYEY